MPFEEEVEEDEDEDDKEIKGFPLIREWSARPSQHFVGGLSMPADLVHHIHIHIFYA